jgi:hypothetical protein
MGRTLVRNVTIPGWGFLVLMEALGFHYLVHIYIYIYIWKVSIALPNSRESLADHPYDLVGLHLCVHPRSTPVYIRSNLPYVRQSKAGSEIQIPRLGRTT